MTDDASRLTSAFFRIFDIDTRVAAKAMLTGDRPQDERRVALLLSALNAVNSTNDLGRITQRVLDVTLELADAERAALFLLDDDGELTLELARHRDHHDLPSDSVFSQSIPKQVADTGVSVCIVDTLEPVEREVGASVHELELRAIMCAPLRVRSEISGVIYLDSRDARRDFSDADLEVFEALCQQYAVTLENAWLNQAMLESEREASTRAFAALLRERLVVPLVGLEGQARMLEAGDVAPDAVADLGRTLRVALAALLEQLEDLEGLAVQAAEALDEEPDRN